MDAFTRFVALLAIGIVIGLAFSFIDIYNLRIYPFTLDAVLAFPYLIFGSGVAVGLLLSPSGQVSANVVKASYLKFREGVGDFFGIVFFGAIVFAVIYFY